MCNWWSDEVFCEEMFISYFLKESLVWVKVKAITKVFCQVKIIMKESMQLVSNTARCISSLREAYKKHSVSFRNIQNNLFIGKFLCIIKFFFLQHLLYSCVCEGEKKLKMYYYRKRSTFLWVMENHTSVSLIPPYISTPYDSEMSRKARLAYSTQRSVSALPSGAVSACTSLQKTSVLWIQLHHPWWCQACEWCHAVGIQVWGKQEHREQSQYSTHASHSCGPICLAWL